MFKDLSKKSLEFFHSSHWELCDCSEGKKDKTNKKPEHQRRNGWWLGLDHTWTCKFLRVHCHLKTMRSYAFYLHCHDIIFQASVLTMEPFGVGKEVTKIICCDQDPGGTITVLD